MAKKKLTKGKAKKILRDKSVRGHPLTEAQHRYFGAVAGGAAAAYSVQYAKRQKRKGKS